MGSNFEFLLAIIKTLYHTCQYMTMYWVKQTSQAPLFQDLLWSRPENKRHAGKLLIIGGNLHGFSAPAQAFSEAKKAGVGVARVILPSSIQKTVGKFMPEAEFTSSTPSGSFAAAALDVWLEHAAWADGVLLAGDLGKNSETAVLIESFLAKYSGQLVITKDALDSATQSPAAVLGRSNVVLVADFAQLQKLAVQAHFDRAFTNDMGLVKLVDYIYQFGQKHAVSIVTKYLDTLVVSCQGRVSTTKTSNDASWQTKTAAYAAVWHIQHPTEPFKALTTSVVA